MSAIQECAVADSLYGKHHLYSSIEEQLYDVTSTTIYMMMELIDGYGYNTALSKLDVILRETGGNLKSNPYIELHDVVVEFTRQEQ